MTRILLIDDDSQLVALLSEYLTRDGFSVATARDGVAGTAEALSGNYSIVILDVMMPRMNGLDVLRAIRRESTLPVLRKLVAARAWTCGARRRCTGARRVGSSGAAGRGG